MFFFKSLHLAKEKNIFSTKHKYKHVSKIYAL